MPFYEPYQKRVRSIDLIFGLQSQRKFYAFNNGEFAKSMRFPSLTLRRHAITVLEKKLLSKETGLIESPALAESLKKHSKYIGALNTPPIPVMVYSSPFNKGKKNFIENPENLTKKCKGAILWKTNNRVVASESKFILKASLHYILDGIIFKDTVFKSSEHDIDFDHLDAFLGYCAKRRGETMFYRRLNMSQQNIRIKNRSITGSELRYIYRNRHNVKFQRAIQFWYKCEPCCPPWHPDFDLLCEQKPSRYWKDYQPRSEVILE